MSASRTRSKLGTASDGGATAAGWLIGACGTDAAGGRCEVRDGETESAAHAIRVSGSSLFWRVRSDGSVSPCSRREVRHGEHISNQLPCPRTPYMRRLPRLGAPVKMLKSVSSLACRARGYENIDPEAVLSIDDETTMPLRSGDRCCLGNPDMKPEPWPLDVKSADADTLVGGC
jgi:hypothetical protein